MNSIAPSVLAKKTKNEVLAEYEKLRAEIEQAKNVAAGASRQEGLDLIVKTKNTNLAEVRESIARAKNDTTASLDGAKTQLYGSLEKLESIFSQELKRFEDLQAAIDASRASLEHQYNLQISAEALETLIADYDAKKNRAQEEFEKLSTALNQEVYSKRINWEREQETNEYNARVKKERREIELNQITQQKEKEWQIREQAITQKEKDLAALRVQLDNMPGAIDKVVSQREKEINIRLESEYRTKLTLNQQEWSAKESLQKQKIDNLETAIKKLENELASSRKEQELASQKAQELAVKVIESGQKLPVGAALPEKQLASAQI